MPDDRGSGFGPVAVTTPLRHPVVDTSAEAVEASSLVLDDVEERAPVELHVGEVLEQHVYRLDVGTLELLHSQRGAMHSREVVDLLTDDDAEVLEARVRKEPSFARLESRASLRD